MHNSQQFFWVADLGLYPGHHQSYTTLILSNKLFDICEKGMKSLSQFDMWTIVWIFRKVYIMYRDRGRLRCCATNRKVAGSIPAGIIEIFY